MTLVLRQTQFTAPTVTLVLRQTHVGFWMEVGSLSGTATAPLTRDRLVTWDEVWPAEERARGA